MVCQCVTPCVGVWIETLSGLPSAPGMTRHTLRGCVDWNLRLSTHPSACGCHTLRGCVDWNDRDVNPIEDYNSHTLRGCVDWNIRLWHNDQSSGVTPCVGVWIETTASCRACITPKSHPAWVCGLKLEKDLIISDPSKVTPCVGVWIETQTWRIRGMITKSHPAWVCGLKHIKLALYFRTLQVTPCVGVWIETPRT